MKEVIPSVVHLCVDGTSPRCVSDDECCFLLESKSSLIHALPIGEANQSSFDTSHCDENRLWW
jgi:hypothetical protein